MGAFLRRDREKVRQDRQWVLALFPVLEKRLKQLAGSLSGGEQQMLAIARALMSSPRLLLLDEPSLGVSPLIVELIADVIRQIRQNGVAILLVEQNSAMALSVADYAYVLQTGRITIRGPARQLRQSEEVRRSYLGFN